MKEKLERIVALGLCSCSRVGGFLDFVRDAFYEIFFVPVSVVFEETTAEYVRDYVDGGLRKENVRKRQFTLPLFVILLIVLFSFELLGVLGR
jgi:hypothetical protein